MVRKRKIPVKKVPRNPTITPPLPNTPTFSDILRQWQQNNAVRLKATTQLKYAYLIDTHIAPQLGHLPVTQLDSARINAFLNDKLQNGRIDQEGGLAPSYVKSMALIITATLKYGVELDWCRPLKGRIHKPALPKKETVVLSAEQQKHLEQAVQDKPTPTHIGILLALYTGLRLGEICALSWDDIDFKTRCLYVRNTVSRVKADGGTKTILSLQSPKTNASKRTIPLTNALFQTLVRCRQNAVTPFVVSEKETFISPRTFEARYHRVLDACGVEPVHFHALRHTFATRCIQAGVDVKTLSEILGHANAAITLNTYVHSSMEMKKCELEKLGTLLPESA